MALVNRDTARRGIEQILSQLPADAVVELTTTGQMPSDQPSRANLKVRIELTSPLPDQLETAADISLPTSPVRQGRKRKSDRSAYPCLPVGGRQVAGKAGRQRKAGDEDIH